MPNLSTLKTLTTSRNFWYIIIALAAFISIAIYVYSNYIAPTIQPAYVPNKEFVKEKASQSQIHLFYVDWCPHSKLAKEEWLKVKEKFNKKVVNGTVLDFIEINGEEEDGQIMKAFEIRRYSVVAGIAILIGAVVLNNVLAGMKEPPKEEPPSDFVVPVKVLAVSNITETADVSINGRIISQRKFDVFTEVNGRLIPTTKEFKNGVSFSKGDVLLQMDDTDVRMNLVSSRSAFQTLLNSLLADLKIDYSNNFELWQSFILQLDPAKILSELPAVTDVKLKGFLVSRNVYNQYYAIKGQEAQLAKFTVTAPFDGVVNQASINPNTILRAGQRVGVFVDPTNYELEAGISLSLNDRISIGNTVQLHSNDVKGRWKGVVSRKSESLDPSTQNLKVYINVKGSNLFEGAYLNGIIMGQSLDSAISIPRYLIVNNNQVYVLNDDKLGLTTVDIIHENRDSMLVSGLADGIELVNQVVPGAHEGMKVQKVN